MPRRTTALHGPCSDAIQRSLRWASPALAPERAEYSYPRRTSVNRANAYDRFAIPDYARNLALLVGATMLIAPYAAGFDFGQIKFPTFAGSNKDVLKWAGPLAFALTWGGIAENLAYPGARQSSCSGLQRGFCSCARPTRHSNRSTGLLHQHPASALGAWQHRFPREARWCRRERSPSGTVCAAGRRSTRSSIDRA